MVSSNDPHCHPASPGEQPCTELRTNAATLPGALGMPEGGGSASLVEAISACATVPEPEVSPQPKLRSDTGHVGNLFQENPQIFRRPGVLLLLGVMVALWTLNPAIRVQFSEGQVTKHLFLLGGASCCAPRVLLS